MNPRATTAPRSRHPGRASTHGTTRLAAYDIAADGGTVERGAVAGALGVTGAGSAAGQRPNAVTGPADAVGFEAGAARVDASPRPADLEQGVYLGGFGIGPQPSREATGLHDGCSARALAATAGDETVVLASYDATGLGNVQQRAVRRRVAERTGLEASRVLIHSTHTHAGPDFQGLWGGVPESYRTYVVERLTEAVVDALAAREPARAFVGAVDARDLASNRRYDGEQDPGTVSALTAVQFRAATGGGTVVTLVNFAAHPTVIGSDNSLVATDYVGPLERAVEDAAGGVAVYAQGPIGDASASAPGAATDYEAARLYGRELASRAREALADADRVHPGLGVAESRVRLPIDNCVFKAGFESGFMRPYYEGESVTGTATAPVADAVGGASPAAGAAIESAPDAGALAIDTRVARVSLGSDRGASVEFLTVPGEAVTYLALDWFRPAMRAAGDYAVTLGLTQNSLGYLIPRARFDDGYEETVSLGPDTGPLYRNAVADLYDLDRARFERVPPGPENACPEVQAQFAGYREEYGPADGPMGVDPA